MMNAIPGGVTAPKGFRASGVHAGIRRNTEKSDLALVAAAHPCAAAAVYTTNRVQASPIAVTKRHLQDGRAQAVLINSGNANCCAPFAEENALACCQTLADCLGVGAEDVAVNSTGVIGKTLPADKIQAAIPALCAALDSTAAAGDAAAAAIMTTDLIPKQAAVTLTLGGQTVTVGAMAKGSGMIKPNMATMIAVLTTDCAIAPELLQTALRESVQRTYNRVSVDGDTSTNDMAVILASGGAKNPEIAERGAEYGAFVSALTAVNLSLAKLIAKDGEGATKLLTCRVVGAADQSAADVLSMSVVSSSLVKAAMFGADANWGRVLCALGYSGAAFDPARTAVSFLAGGKAVKVCENGQGLDFDEALAKEILQAAEVSILCELRDGAAEAEAYGCDLTYDYVKINGDYRT
jgi:glutamate N-acetyltransferase/amino-acid N-acetyltransferase